MLKTHMRLVSCLGSKIHIQNTDLTILQSMTQVAADRDFRPAQPLPSDRTDN